MGIGIGASHLRRANIGTVHNAAADYIPAEHRCMRRARVMATLDHPALVA